MYMTKTKWVVGAIAAYFLVAWSAGVQAQPDAKRQAYSGAQMVAKDPSTELTPREYSDALEANDSRSPRAFRVSTPRIVLDPSVSPLLYGRTVELLQRFPLRVPLTAEAAEALVSELFYYEDTGDDELNWQWEGIVLATIATAMDHPYITDDAWYVLDDGLAEFRMADTGTEGGAAGAVVDPPDVPRNADGGCWWEYDKQPKEGKVNWAWTIFCDL